MNILISCYSFYPSVGGLEEVNALLARAFVARGHAVKVMTMTRSTEPDNDTFEIMRDAEHIRSRSRHTVVRCVLAGECQLPPQAGRIFSSGVHGSSHCTAISTPKKAATEYSRGSRG